MVGRQTATPRLPHISTFCDTDQRIVRLIHVLAEEEAFVGGDDGKIVLVGKVQKVFFDPALVFEAVTLQLHIKPSAIHTGQRFQQLLGRLILTVDQ